MSLSNGYGGFNKSSGGCQEDLEPDFEELIETTCAGRDGTIWEEKPAERHKMSNPFIHANHKRT